MEAKLALARLLSKYKFKACSKTDKEQLDLKISIFSINPKRGVWITAILVCYANLQISLSHSLKFQETKRHQTSDKRTNSSEFKVSGYFIPPIRSDVHQLGNSKLPDTIHPLVRSDENPLENSRKPGHHSQSYETQWTSTWEFKGIGCDPSSREIQRTFSGEFTKTGIIHHFFRSDGFFLGIQSTSHGREGRKAYRSIVTRSEDSEGLASTTVSMNPSIIHHKDIAPSSWNTKGTTFEY
ncbi:hypothetical protein CEXT_391031 [Caerostris extrusa]|uniref:Uncharacterized protein n=1 Tax=Caerostris extrusa TaxID=172846 RepID=A0AAV4Y5A2_CAEEX|nr:hypothetical protein CEXT_391031 [Caerostris extrusa]